MKVLPVVLLVGSVSGSTAAAAEAPPAEAFRVLAEAAAEGPAITPLLRHQLDRAWRQDAERRATYEAVRNETDLLRLRAETRARLLRVIGGLPGEKTPLNARVVGAVALEGYRVEKLVFESLPGLLVTALVYLPDAPAGPKPAVLLASGHSPLGKAYPAYQEIAGRLARRGYVVLCWDPVGQGERSQFWDAARGRSRYNLVCGEHAVLGNLAVLAGTNLIRFMVWDGIRALDYLLTRPEVDAGRISITGTSGGGFQSAYIGALDERVGVVAPSCFITSLPMRMANRIFQDPDSDPEQDPPGLVSEGIDHAGLLLLVYPRPVHVAAAVQDFFPIEGTRKTVREVASLYRLAGRADRIALAEGYHTHRYSPENQLSAFSFLDRFNGLPAPPGLDSVRTLEPEALRCTPSGQVRVGLGGRSLTEIIRELGQAERRRGAIDLPALYYGAGYSGVKTWPVVAYEGRPAFDAIAVETRPRTEHSGATIDRYVLHHSERLLLPVLHIRRAGAGGGEVVLDFDLTGKAAPGSWPKVEAQLAAGREVLSLDLRGVGETRMRYKATSIDDPELGLLDDAAAYVSPISGVLANYVYNSLLAGRPYLLETIEDLEIACRFARARLGAQRVAIAPRGEAWTLGWAATVVLPDTVLLGRPEGAAFSWSDAVEQMREQWPIHYLLPGGVRVRVPEARP
jgi:dienelactone hydrolase